MNYTKLFKPAEDNEQLCCVQIHSDSYLCTLDHVLKMALELRKDFSVNDEDIQVQKYGGERRKGITFIEAFLPRYTKMPEGYEEIKQLEYIL